LGILIFLENMEGWLKNLFEAIDRKDTDGFVSFLTEDACFRFANAPVIRGRKDIANAVGLFFSGIKSIRHRVVNVWKHDYTIICEGEVTYVRQNGSVLTLPFADVFRMQAGLISDYRIYMDISPLGT
jgi:ketosteroid isomerase-like protein